jgi:hypothetical protein
MQDDISTQISILMMPEMIKQLDRENIFIRGENSNSYNLSVQQTGRAMRLR